MCGVSKDARIALAVAGLVLATMAVDHLIGTEEEPGEQGGLADPGAFVFGVLVSVALLAVLFWFVVRRRRNDPPAAAKAGLVSSALAVPALALIFLGVQLPLAGAGIALGLHGRAGERRGLATAAVALGSLVAAATVAAYAAALA